MGPQPEPDAPAAQRAAAGARRAGLDVVVLREEATRVEFRDVGAVVHFLRKVVWTVPDFTVDRYRDRLPALYELIDRDGSFVAPSQRYLLEVRRPGEPAAAAGPGELSYPAGDTGRVSALDRFSAPTRAWFTGAFAQPTAAQEGAWDAIAAASTPSSSPPPARARRWRRSSGRWTGWPPPRRPTSEHRCRVLYVSPLKALAVDVERNLRAPLTGIGQAAPGWGCPAGDPGRHPLRRHPGRRAPRARPPPAGHPDHHARVAVPAADQLGRASRCAASRR